MKKTTLSENAKSAFEAFFDEENFQRREIAVSEKNSLHRFSTGETESGFLDALLASIKFIFLYLPGVAAISLLVLSWVIFSFYENIELELVTGSLGFLTIGTFMIMIGIGKLSDLRYLKVVGAIVSASILEAILFWLVAALAGKLDYFGSFLLAMWILNASIGYLVKRNLDEKVVVE